jgi:hypothetical protein
LLDPTRRLTDEDKENKNIKIQNRINIGQGMNRGTRDRMEGDKEENLTSMLTTMTSNKKKDPMKLLSKIMAEAKETIMTIVLGIMMLIRRVLVEDSDKIMIMEMVGQGMKKPLNRHLEEGRDLQTMSEVLRSISKRMPKHPKLERMDEVKEKKVMVTRGSSGNQRSKTSQKLSQI